MPTWDPHMNAHFMVPKKNRKYHSIISAVSANQRTLEISVILPNVKECSEAFPRLPIFFVIDLHLLYDQAMLHKDSRNYLAIQTQQGMYWPTRLVWGATNSVSAFGRVSQKIVNAHLHSIAESFVDNG